MMIDYFQCQRLAEKTGAASETTEKDYFIELVLFHIVKDTEFADKLIFRGGTALKKVYFPNYRFSEDLDFLVEDKEDLDNYVIKFGETIEKINSVYPYNLGKRVESRSDRLQLFIKYNIIPEVRAVKELKIDIIKDTYIPPTSMKQIEYSHDEFKHEKAAIRIYTLESVAVDKICRILSVDTEPRDLYDLWYLLKLDVSAGNINEGLKKKFGCDIQYPGLISAIGEDDYKKNWEIRLTKQITDLPPFALVLEELEELIVTKLSSF